MPYRRKRRFKRKRGKYTRKRKFKRYKSMNSMTRYGRSKYNIHSFKRYGRTDSLNMPNTAGGFVSKSFTWQLNNMTGFTDIQNTYDQCRINMVVVKITWSPKQSPGIQPSAGLGGVGIAPNLYWFKDYDDSGPLTTLDQYKERGNIKNRRLSPYSTINIPVKVACLKQIYLTSISQALCPVWGQKLDIGTGQAVPHFGLKLCADYISGHDLGSLDIQTVYYVTAFGAR